MSDAKIFECPGCGARVTGDKKFCDYCGGKLKLPEEKKQSPETSDTQLKEETESIVNGKPVDVVKEENKQTQKANDNSISCGTIIVVMIIVGILIWLFMRLR